MTGDLDATFQKATEDVKTLPKAPDSDVMLRLYACFKQATKGDCLGERPGMMDFVGRAKYDAWLALAGTSQDEAKRQYIAIVQELVEASR